MTFFFSLAFAIFYSAGNKLKLNKMHEYIFIRLLFLDAHRETSALVNALPEESDQFRFLHTSYFANLKGAVGLIMTKASAMRISIPLDLSSRSFVPLPCFIRSRRPTPLLTPSLVLFPPCSA